VRRDWHLDASASGPAKPPQKGRSGLPAGQLRQRYMIVGPCQSAGRIEKPVAGSITDATANRAGREHRLAEGFCADRRRKQFLDDTDVVGSPPRKLAPNR
jgi:hypothetical protein